MKLSNILKNIKYELIQGSLDIDIKDISYNSKNIDKNYAFIALIGIDTDGHKFINEAINNGANCIFICKDIKINNDLITIIKVDDTRTKLSYISANFFNNPQDKLIKIGITGTKGKTSTSWMLKKILEENGEKVGVIGTLGTYINNEKYSHKNTTPESYQIQKFMNIMVNNNVKYLIMEVSSQALKVGRINNIIFDYAIFTNLSIDHIGPREHPTFEDYINSKALLFKQSKIGILNMDDSKYKDMIKDATCKILTYGTNKNSNLCISNIKFINNKEFLGTEFKLNNSTYRVSAPGKFSCYNAASAIYICKLLNIDNNIIKKGLENFFVDGRCEIININNKFKIVIDFAHNKISMESIIKTMREFNCNRIITIFGCGGGRSFERRYELGEVSGKLSDLSIITTDNPRNDNIDSIINDIKKGIIDQNGKYIIIKDRKKAIEYAIDNANVNDIILLLGKGHEKYQEIKGVRYPFDEKSIIKSYINK